MSSTRRGGKRVPTPHLPQPPREQSAQQVSLACAGLQDTGVGGREGTDHVGSAQPLGTRFGVEHHKEIS